MPRFLALRFTQAFFTLWIVSVLVFLSVRLAGSPEFVLLPPDTRPAERVAFREAYGLDQPLTVQYARWISRAIVGDFGEAIGQRAPVMDLIRPRLVDSIKLGTVAMLMATVLSVPLGVLAASRRGTWLDKLAMIIGVGGQALPSFFLGILLVMVFAVLLGILPATGAGSWRHYILPSFTIGYFVTAGAMRLIRSSMLEVLDSEFIKLARSKGIPERIVIWKHALRNALLPVLTFMGFMFGVIIAASITVETIFNWPGIGRLVFDGLLRRDYPVVQAIVLISASIVILLNLAVDVVYAILDPRVRI